MWLAILRCHVLIAQNSDGCGWRVRAMLFLASRTGLSLLAESGDVVTEVTEVVSLRLATEVRREDREDREDREEWPVSG